MSDENTQHGTPSPPPPPPSRTPAPPAPADTAGGVRRSTDSTSEVDAAPRNQPLTLTPSLVLGIVAVAAIVIGLFVKESEAEGATSANLWDRTSAPLWSIMAIAAAVATLLPVLRTVFNVPAKLAWTIAAIGAGYLVFWWVLFVLPQISLNVAFLTSAGVAAAVAAVWTSTDNPRRDEYTAS